MPEKFIDQMARTHHTKPMMNARDTDEKSIQLYGGIGVRTGFHTVLDPAGNSINVQVTRGLIVGPLGGKLTTGNDGSRTPQAAAQAIVRDFALVNVRSLLGAAVYDALVDTTHQILLTIDSVTHGFKAHKITSAEATTIKGQITDLAPAGSALGAGFDSATGDHAARGNVSKVDPDNLNGTAALVATEFILAVLEKSDATPAGVIDLVTLERERDAYSVFSGLTG
jgi:hypothetical protein